MKKIFTLFLLVAVSQLLSACNTVHGFGKDVEKVGEKMQEKSSK
jgi:entericidin A